MYGSQYLPKKQTLLEKSNIVIEFFNINTSVAEICRKHNVSPTTLQNWKKMFLKGGRQALADREYTTKNHSKKIGNLKRIIRKITITNDILKKPRL